jgi:hypothetical protein
VSRWLARLSRRLPLRRLHEDEGGQAMIEFVLVFPVQLLLSLSILQFAFLAKAHIVVEQAAFMAARAAAVADVPGAPADPNEAARRVAARTLVVLTSGAPPPTGGGTQATPMRWTGQGGGHEVSQARLQEAFGFQQLDVIPYKDDGYLCCALTYDYVLTIPVANHMFAQAQVGFDYFNGNFNDASRERGETVYRIRRVAFVSTPWTKKSAGGTGAVNPTGQ